MLKVGIVGSGFMGQTHADAYAKTEGVEIAGFVDLAKERREELAHKYKASAFDTLDQLLDAADPDIIDICLPTNLNAAFVEGAAKAGKAILVEKPIALNLEDADRIISVARENKVKIMVAHVLRFWPRYVHIRELILSKEIGDVISVDAVRVCTTPEFTDWYRMREVGGGAVINLLIHDLDFCNWLFGSPQQVYAAGTKSSYGSLDDVACVISYEGGIQAAIKGSFMMPRTFPFTMQFFALGDRGCIEFDFRAGENLEDRENAIDRMVLFKNNEYFEIESDPKDAYLAEIEYFVKCVAEDRDPEIATLDDARAALALALACIESADTGSPVTSGIGVRS